MPGKAFLVESIKRHCQAVLTAMSGEQGEAAVTVGALVAGADQRLWLRYEVQDNGVSLSAGATETDWRCLGKVVLGEEADAPDSADHQPTYIEIANQIAASIFRDITSQVGVEVTANSKEAVAPTEGSPFLATITIAGSRQASILFVASASLLQMLEPPAPKVPTPQFAADQPNQDPRTMDLLLDVELPVCISFGSTLLPLREVIKLSSGSIVELSRAINEPVDLIVNNCVIARGEVVVVEGNYGVKIIQIVARHERLRTLH